MMFSLAAAHSGELAFENIRAERARPDVTIMPSAAAAFAIHPNRWASNGAERAKDAAIPRQWFQHCAAAGAVVEILTGIGRHGFGLFVPALGASQRRFKDQGAFRHWYMPE
jgi:hypothetical protein